MQNGECSGSSVSCKALKGGAGGAAFTVAAMPIH